ncbi:MAG: STAS domain-containing protein [Spirochaetota bacterium]
MNIEMLYLSKHQDEAVGHSNTVLRVDIADVADADKAGAMWLICRSLVAGGTRKMIINMDGLDFIDSRGIGIIISIAKLIREDKGDVVLVGVADHIDRIFRPVNLQRFIKMFKTEAEALGYFKYM